MAARQWATQSLCAACTRVCVIGECLGIFAAIVETSAVTCNTVVMSLPRMGYTYIHGLTRRLDMR